MKFDKYELLDELGSGSFGVVYKALDLNLNRTIAIKVLHPNLAYLPGLLEKFRQEARLAAQLSHPNIVPVYDFGQFEGQSFLVMAYMPGGSLRDLLIAKVNLDEYEAYQIFSDLVKGVEHVHSKGIVHRGLKPSNILFDSEGIARIADLGFARTLTTEDSHSMSMSGGMVGTPHYMAPELWEGKNLTPAADQYSLGCILYEMLSGEKLFDGETAPTVMMKHFRPIEFKVALSHKSFSIITRMTEKYPEARFESLVEVREFLHPSSNKVKTALGTVEEIPIVSSKSEKKSEDESAGLLIVQEEEPLLDDEDEDEVVPTPKHTKSKRAKEAVVSKVNIFENPKIRLALIAALVILLLSGFALIGSKNAWFTQNGLAKTETLQAHALMLTQNWLAEQPSETKPAITSLGKTKTRTPTKTKSPTKTASRTPTLTLSPSPSPTLTRQIT